MNTENQVPTLRHFTNGGIVVLNENTSSKEAARAMYERRVGSIVVSNHDGIMTGILTDRDLATQMLAFNYSSDHPIKEFMSSNIFKISESSTLQSAIRLMEENGIRRVPVIQTLESGRERCVGIVTLDDLIAEKAIDPQSLSRIVSQQILGKTKKHVHPEETRTAHLEQTLNRFYNILSKKLCLPRPTSDAVTFCLLSSVVRRLPPSGAAQLISQMPFLLQEDLLGLRAGPNREITGKSIRSILMTRFNMSFKETEYILERFWEGIETFTAGSGEFNHAIQQLPIEMRTLMNPKSA